MKTKAYRKVMVGIYLDPEQLTYLDQLKRAGKIQDRGKFIRGVLSYVQATPTALKAVLDGRTGTSN